MKKRVLLALTMAMATAAMFISPALSDTSVPESAYGQR